jgi:hypothetical protein
MMARPCQDRWPECQFGPAGRADQVVVGECVLSYRRNNVPSFRGWKSSNLSVNAVARAALCGLPMKIPAQGIFFDLHQS